MKSWHPLEHQVYRSLRGLPLQNRNLILAVSGGRDSMALLHILRRLAGAAGFHLAVVHVHHGWCADLRQRRFRDAAQTFVAEVSQSLGVPFFTNNPTKGLERESEASLRDVRYSFLRRLQRQQQAVIVTAHHEQDLIETQLINLIRGTGPRGLRSLEMFASERQILRPLLAVSAAAVAEYTGAMAVKFRRDPSNSDIRYLRNWIRRKWLPDLEKKRAGSVRALARSLALVSARVEVRQSLSLVSDRELLRPIFRQASRHCQKAAVVELFRQNQIPSYTKAHVEEFLRRLDSRQKNLKFRLLRHNWIADAERVRLLRDSTSSRQSI